MKIIKAKITKDSTLVATYKDENGTTTVEGKNLVTSDLINAFSKLNPHAALLTEQKEVDGIESVDEVPDIIGQVLDVTGYSIGGDGDNEGVTLVANRISMPSSWSRKSNPVSSKSKSICSTKNGELYNRNFRLRKTRRTQTYNRTPFQKPVQTSIKRLRNSSRL